MNINATLIFQAIAFFFFVSFCMKFVWPPVIAALRERQNKINEGLNASSRAERDLELAQERATEQLRNAKMQAQEIVEQAKKRASLIIDEAHMQAESEAQTIIKQARSNFEQEVNLVKDSLRLQLGNLVVLGAEKLLAAEINKEAHAHLVEELANEL